MSDHWRVDIKGYPIVVIGEYAREHLEKAYSEYCHMKLALHKIIAMDPENWGKQGIWAAQKIAREALKP
jgi:hypothetical protein